MSEDTEEGYGVVDALQQSSFDEEEQAATTAVARREMEGHRVHQFLRKNLMTLCPPAGKQEQSKEQPPKRLLTALQCVALGLARSVIIMAAITAFRRIPTF